MTQWFIQKGEGVEDLGPLPPSELLKMVRDGVVTRDTLIRKDDSAWFVASEVGGLFEAAMRPTIQYFCPHCEAEIVEPPVKCNRCGKETHDAITRITENTIANR